MCRIGQLLYELANSLKLANSMVRYMRIGHFGELANSVLQLSSKYETSYDSMAWNYRLKGIV